MSDPNDIELLREYVASNSEAAFAELVRRHINLVHSVAFRYVGNSQDAEDVAQAVFIILAKKADRLSDNAVLTGWLYETTRFTAMNVLRTQRRRHSREQETYLAAVQNSEDTENAWKLIEPLLEEAMSKLSEKDRTLLALHFFENKSGAETANILGIEEWAARKRVARAVEKLRTFFARRDVRVSSVLVVGAVSANAVQAAPPTLVDTVSSVAMTKGTVASGATLAVVKGGLKVMAWAKMKTALLVGTVVILTGGTTAVVLKELIKAKGPSHGVKVLAEFDWSKMKSKRELLAGEVVKLAGHTVLKISETNQVPTVWTLFKIQKPPITEMHYSLTGEVKCENVELDGYIATWNYFPAKGPGLSESQYYSYTGDIDGPQEKFHGTSDWRTFSLPLDRTTGNIPTNVLQSFDATTTALPPSHIDVHTFLPGGGTVYLRNVKLTEWSTPTLAGSASK